MGWLYGNETNKADFVKSVLDDVSILNKVVKSSVVNNHLWVVVKCDNKNVIMLYLMSKYDGVWGCKSIPESSHPYYYDCPLYFFNYSKDFINEEWREKVRDFHKEKSNKRSFISNLKVGDKIELKNSKIPFVTCSRLIGTKIYGTYNNMEFKIPKSMVKI